MQFGRRIGAVAVAIVAMAGMALGTGPASAFEHANPDYLGILSAQPASGYPVSPAFTDISGGPVTLTISVAVHNLTNQDQDVPMDFSVHHVLTYQGVDISDGQPGQPGISFPKGAASQTTQVAYGPRQTNTFSIPAASDGSISFQATFSTCGYFQIDFNRTDQTNHKKVWLASGFTRVLGCQFAQRFTPGYWKNHQAATEARLPQTIGGDTVSTFAQVTAIFDAMKCSAPVNCLAGHLLAAQLDVANGSSACIQSTIDDANAFLTSVSYTGPGSYTLTSTQKAQALALEQALDSYTNDSSAATC